MRLNCLYSAASAQAQLSICHIGWVEETPTNQGCQISPSRQLASTPNVKTTHPPANGQAASFRPLLTKYRHQKHKPPAGPAKFTSPPLFVRNCAHSLVKCLRLAARYKCHIMTITHHYPTAHASPPLIAFYNEYIIRLGARIDDGNRSLLQHNR
jgi:hypothetical protein